MKIYIRILMFLLLIGAVFPLNNSVNAERKEKDDLYPKELEKIIDVQKKERIEIDKIINEEYGEYQKFEEDGVLYTTQDGVLYIGYKEEKDKVRKLKKKVEDKKLSPEKVKFIKVKYTQSELLEKQADLQQVIYEYVNFDEQNIEISASGKEQKIVLTLDYLSEEHKAALQHQFGDLLEIRISPPETNLTPFIDRVRHWTKLGGGITVWTPTEGRCSTAGVVKKGTNWFILTAGHCLGGSNGSYVYQENLTSGTFIVGLQHSQARYASLDAGLIRVTEDDNLPSGRRASNYFYKWAEDNDDYDAQYTGVGYVAVGDAYCKSGHYSKVTCGIVTNAYDIVDYRNDGYGGFKVAKVENTFNEDMYLMAGPGDSGATVYDNYTNVAYGILSGGDENDPSFFYFTKLTDVLSHYSSPGYPMSFYTSPTVIQITQPN